MRKFAIYALAGMLTLPVSIASAQFNQKGGLKPIHVPPTQTPTPVGFASVLCVADGISGASLPGSTIDIGPVTIEGSNPSIGAPPATSTVLVTITNNRTAASSSYVVTFVDNNTDSTLNCGDTIVSVVPAS